MSGGMAKSALGLSEDTADVFKAYIDRVYSRYRPEQLNAFEHNP